MNELVKGLPLIGKGTFSKVYKESEHTVLIVSEDPVKEVMGLGWFPNSRLFPKLERLESDTFRCKLYTKCKAPKKELKPKEYEKYLVLRKLFQSNWSQDYHTWYNAFKTIKIKSLREAMLGALEACTNLGSDIGFEISPRNIACHNGNLVLLDCFFMVSKLKEVKTAKRC